MILIPILFFLGILWWKLWRDLRSWEANKPIDHKDGVINLAIAHGYTSGLMFVAMSNSMILAIPVVTIMIASWHWLLFDGFFNVLRGYDWWFTGSDDPDDAKSDNFLQKLALWQHISIKIGLVLIFTLTYFIFLH